MVENLTSSLKLFYCYAREDRALRDELDLHLSGLKRQRYITSWSDREIAPGVEWEKEIDTHLNTADIILLLVSPHFMASDYCYGVEMERALQRHQTGTARVIPIVMRPVDWHGAPFSTLQMLPTDAKPITRWPDRDEAFWDVATNIRLMIQKLNLVKTTQEKVASSLSVSKANIVENLMEQGNTLLDHGQYDEAIEVFDRVLPLDPNNSNAYNNKGSALNGLGRYEEGLASCETAIRFNPNNSMAYNNKGVALYLLGRYEEGIAAYNSALRIDPNNSIAQNNKKIVIENLRER
jgi:tetratricopeptide (TPR) repeat protein